MQPVRPPIARNSTTNRSAVTNGSKLLVGIDGRSPTARRFRDLVEAYSAEIGGELTQFEKAMLVAKLKGARDRKRRTGVKVEGRRTIAETRPEVIELARKLYRTSPKAGRRSLRTISAELAKAGHMTATGKPFAATAIKLMLAIG